MPRSDKAQGGDAHRRRTSPPLALALLGASAVVIGVTIYIAVRPPEPSIPAVPSAAGPTPAQRTRRAVEDLLARADAVAPDATPLLKAKQREAYVAACDLARRFIDLEDRRDIVVRPVLAAAHLRPGRAADAERTIDEMLVLSPQSAEGLWMKGELLRMRGQDPMPLFRQAAESDQAGGEVWARYGLELLNRSQDQDAGEYLRRAEKAGCRPVPVLAALGRLSLQANQFDQAEAYLQQAAQAAGGGEPLWLLLAEAQKNRGRLAEAEQTLRKALDVRQSGELWMQLGEVLLLQRRRDDAAEAFGRAAEYPSIAPLAALKAARTYYVLGRQALAMKYVDLAAEGHADVPEIQQWVRKIEDARFGGPSASPPAGFRLPSPGELPPRPGDANAATQPAAPSPVSP